MLENPALMKQLLAGVNLDVELKLLQLQMLPATLCDRVGLGIPVSYYDVARDKIAFQPGASPDPDDSASLQSLLEQIKAHYQELLTKLKAHHEAVCAKLGLAFSTFEHHLSQYAAVTDVPLSPVFSQEEIQSRLTSLGSTYNESTKKLLKCCRRDCTAAIANYVNNSQSVNGRKRFNLPKHAVTALRSWLFNNFLLPYPGEKEKLALAHETGLTPSQVNNWFINARVRVWRPLVEDLCKESELLLTHGELEEKPAVHCACHSSGLTLNEANHGAESTETSMKKRERGCRAEIAEPDTPSPGCRSSSQKRPLLFPWKDAGRFGHISWESFKGEDDTVLAAGKTEPLHNAWDEDQETHVKEGNMFIFGDLLRRK